MKTGPIVVIEDDKDDMDIFASILEELKVKNKLVWLETTDAALEYLSSGNTQPFLIFSDINLPGKNGLDLKKKIDGNPHLRKKSIPFIFYSTSSGQQDVNEAYTQMTIQGFFRKANEYDKMKEMIKLIIDYWSVCLHPNAG